MEQQQQQLKEQPPPPPPPTTPADPPAAEGSSSSALEFVAYSGPQVKRGGGKKPRPFTSCISCRRRKIRCLNENIPCKPCLEYGEVCSLLATEEAQNYQPPPPEVLKDQGIKVKRRRKTSTTRRQSIKKAQQQKLLDGEADEAGPSAAAGPSTAPPPKAARTKSDPSTSASRPGPARSLSAPSAPEVAHSVSPSALGSSDYGADPGRHLAMPSGRAPFAQPALPQASILPPTLAPQQRPSPLVSNSLGSLSIRRDSTSPATTPLSLKRPHDWDFMPPLHNHPGALSAASPSFPLPSPSFFGASPNYVIPSPAPLQPPPPPPPRVPMQQQQQQQPHHLPQQLPPLATAKSPIKLDFLLTPWSPTNDAIGPGSIRPRPLEPLPPATDRPNDGGGLARPPELEPVIEESPENSQLAFSPQVARPPSATLGATATAKSEPLSTPATTVGSLRHPTPSPALALSAGGGQTPGGIPGYSTSLGSFTSPYEGRSPLPQELLETLAEPAREERAAFQSAFKTALGWLFPWCDPARIGKGSRGGQWALWSLGVRMSETEDKTKMDRARTYLTRAKELAGIQAISSEPTIDHLETIILIAWADYGLAESARATWNWCGVAMRIAEGLGMYDPDPGIIPRLTVVLQSLYQLDKILSIRLHRPPSFPLSSPLSKHIPRPVSFPTSAFEAITTLCAFLGQIAYSEYQVGQDLMTEREARGRTDQVLQDLESWLTDLKGKNGYLTRKDEAESRGRVWVELWLQGVFILLNSPRLLLPQALPLDTHIDVARSSASAVSTLVQTYSSFSPSVLISPYLDVPVHFALSTIESDIEGMASPAQGLAGLGQGIMKGQRLEESRALRDWLREAGSIWGF